MSHRAQIYQVQVMSPRAQIYQVQVMSPQAQIYQVQVMIFQLERMKNYVCKMCYYYFQERDENQTGKITWEQLIGIYRIYEVNATQLNK